MTRITRFAWYLGNWVAQIVIAVRIGYRDGYSLRPGTRPSVTNESRGTDNGN